MPHLAEAAQTGSSKLHLTIDAAAINITGLSPGGSVVLFSCTRMSRIRSIAVNPSAILLRDENQDGAIRYEPIGGVPLRSVWIAVDQSTGEAVPIAPSEFPLIVSAIGGDDLQSDGQGEIGTMNLGLPRVSLLLVRPGVGVWLITGFDGDKTDHDQRADGRAQLRFEDATAVFGKERSPKHLKKGDTVVAIDPGHLDVFMTTIGN